MDKLLNACFIALLEEPSWLLPIVVVPKKNNKLWIWINFLWFNVITKKDPYPLPFIEEVLDEVASHEVYLFFDEFLNYH